MKVFIEKTGKTVSIKAVSITGAKLLENLKLSADSVIIVQNNTVMLPEEVLSDKDEIKLLSVVSGG